MQPAPRVASGKACSMKLRRYAASHAALIARWAPFRPVPMQPCCGQAWHHDFYAAKYPFQENSPCHDVLGTRSGGSAAEPRRGHMQGVAVRAKSKDLFKS